jgi:solute carrier family 6 (neurotransmitter transporter)
MSSFPVVFLLQFLLLSFCFGIPLFTLFCSMGQYLGSGLIDMWRISPIFQVTGGSASYQALAVNTT